MRTLNVKQFAMFMIAFVSMGFVACSSDDPDDPQDEKKEINIQNEKKEVSPLIGTWTCDHHYIDRDNKNYPSTTDTFVFLENNTYEWTCKSWEKQTGTYFYNSELSTLSLSNFFNRTRSYTVTGISSTFFIIKDDDGDSYTYYKK